VTVLVFVGPKQVAGKPAKAADMGIADFVIKQITPCDKEAMMAGW